MTAQLENSILDVKDMTAEEMAQSIRDFSREALAVLNARREAEYAAACVPLDKELTALAVESADIEAQSQGVLDRLASAERVKRFEYDQLNMQGKTEEAQAKLEDLEEIKAAPVRIEERRREISNRVDQIETEKRTALRRAAEDFRDASIALIRGSETGLATALDEVRATLNTLEMQTGSTLYMPENLTTGERTAGWVTLNRLYSGRVR